MGDMIIASQMRVMRHQDVVWESVDILATVPIFACGAISELLL